MVDVRPRERPDDAALWLLGEDDLPYSEEVRMESHQHALNAVLLTEPLWRVWAPRQSQPPFIGADMFVYFSPDQVRTTDFRGPDVFVVRDAPQRERPRKSWVVWQEGGKTPDVVIELISESTGESDKTAKLLVYQDRLHVPEYFLFDPLSGELLGYRLVCGVYHRIEPDAHGRLASERLGLLLVRWQGRYAGVEAVWLRWAWPDGALLPLPEEAEAHERRRTELERERAEAERQRAEAERQRAEAEERRARALADELARYRARFGDLTDDA